MKKSISKYSIVFCSDQYYIKHTLKLIDEIERQSKYEFEYILIIPNRNIISDLNFNKIKIIEFDIWIKKTNYYLPNSFSKRITNFTNVRLFLPEILQTYQSVLYLDSDIIIEGDIINFFKFIEMSKEKGSFAVESYRPKKTELWELIGRRKEGYFNAGVLFLDLEELRGSYFTNNSIRVFEKYGNSLRLADQDVINILINFKTLPWRFNITRTNQFKNFNNIKNLKIYHYVSEIKPWMKFSEQWKKYLFNKIEFKIDLRMHIIKTIKSLKWKK